MEKQFHTYKASIYSFETTEVLLGLLRPGRYSGFDDFSLHTQGGSSIVVHMNHSTESVKKSSKSVPPVLGKYTGVILTPQGQVIHNDDADITLSIPKNNEASIRYDLIYCEHQYLLSSGSNPATYNVQSGVAGQPIPALDNPEKRVLIATVTVGANAATFSSLTFTLTPTHELGGLTHSEILSTLLGVKTDYTSEYYINKDNTVIENLSTLDNLLHSANQGIIDLNQTKLDDWGVPDDNTDLNATTLRHGLLPKLSGSTSNVLRGDGSWGDLGNGGVWKWTDRPFGVDFSLSSGSLNISQGYIDISYPLTSPDASEALLKVMFSVNTAAGNAARGQIHFADENGRNNFNCPMLTMPSLLGYQSQVWQFVVKLNPSNPIKRVYLTVTTSQGTEANWLNNANGLSEVLILVEAYR